MVNGVTRRKRAAAETLPIKKPKKEVDLPLASHSIARLRRALPFNRKHPTAGEGQPQKPKSLALPLPGNGTQHLKHLCTQHLKNLCRSIFPYSQKHEAVLCDKPGQLQKGWFQMAGSLGHKITGPGPTHPPNFPHPLGKTTMSPFL